MPKGFSFKRNFLTRSHSASLGPADKHLREINNLGGMEMDDGEQNLQAPAKKRQRHDKPKSNRIQKKRAPASKVGSQVQPDKEFEGYERQHEEMMNSVDEVNEVHELSEQVTFLFILCKI